MSRAGHVIFLSFQRSVSKAAGKLFTSFFHCWQSFLGSRKFLSGKETGQTKLMFVPAQCWCTPCSLWNKNRPYAKLLFKKNTTFQSCFLITIVRIFICVGTMAAAFYNQTTLFYNQTNSLCFTFIISRERSEWAQCYCPPRRKGVEL